MKKLMVMMAMMVFGFVGLADNGVPVPPQIDIEIQDPQSQETQPYQGDKGPAYGVTVNGVDLNNLSGEGWIFWPNPGYVELTGPGPYVLSGTDVENRGIMFAINTDATVTLDNLSLKCQKDGECCIWATNDVNVTLYLKGTNTLDASPCSGEGLCIENHTTFTIGKADGETDESAVLIAKGGREKAGIAVSVKKTGSEGALLTIAGGTVEAYGGAGAAGIGGSHYSAWTYGGYHTTLAITGGRVFAHGGADKISVGAYQGSGAGIGSAAEGYWDTTEILISGGYVEAYGGPNAAGIGGGCDSIGPTVRVTGGTVCATRGTDDIYTGKRASDMANGHFRSSGAFQVSGGSILLANGSARPQPTTVPGEGETAKDVWCVSVGIGDRRSGIGDQVEIVGLEGYGLNDVVPVDGKLGLWLPNGTYDFTVNGFRYHAKVNGADAAAELQPLGVTVNGVDVSAGVGDGWTYYPATRYVEVTGGGEYVLSGANTAGEVMFAIDDDADVTLSNLCLRCTTVGECCLWATNGVNVTLYLAGTNTLDASAGGEGLCIENDTRLVITNAPGFVDVAAELRAEGSKDHAAIAVGRNGSEGVRPYFEIAGGTVCANWFISPKRDSVGIGGSDYAQDKNIGSESDIEISGGRVFARGGDNAPGIGSAFLKAGARIQITGGYVVAEGGDFAAGIGGSQKSANDSVVISGGTVRATGGRDASDMIRGFEDWGGGDFTIAGGSVVLTRLFADEPVEPNPAPSNGTDRVWCVTVTNLTPFAKETILSPEGYGTKDIVADADGKVCLWLPNGAYTIDVREVKKNEWGFDELLGVYRYEATVDGANVIATRVGRVFGVTINGREVGLGPETGNDGWTLDLQEGGGAIVSLDGTKPYVLSGTSVDNYLLVSVTNGAEVTFKDLCTGAKFSVSEGKLMRIALEGENILKEEDEYYNVSDISGDAAIRSAEEGATLSILGHVSNGTLQIDCGRVTFGSSAYVTSNIKVAGGTVTFDEGATLSQQSTTVDGGSVKVPNLSATTPALMNSADATLWCVTVPVGVSGAKVTIDSSRDAFSRPLPEYYGLNDIYAVDGNVYLWLPGGDYKFNADFGSGPIPYKVTVDGAHVEAVIDSDTLTGVKVNGRDTGLGGYDGCGWTRTADKYVELDGTVDYVISGSNDVGNVMIAVNGDANVTLSNLYLKCTTPSECCFWATNNTAITLFLAGVNTLDAYGSSDTANMGEGLCIENGTRLTITNAPGFADADAVLIAKGSFNRAAIAVGRNGDEGAKPCLEIAGGTVYANWFNTPARYSAGIGASYETGRTGHNGDADIVISGGFVFAKGGSGDPGIGASDYNSYGAPAIRITGGYVEAEGGEHAPGIGGAYQSKHGNVTVVGGTVRATGGADAFDMIVGKGDRGGGGFTISGGSVVLTRLGTVAPNPAPTNALGMTLWCVTVTNLTPFAAVSLTGLDGVGYGTDDIVTDADGKLCLWLPYGVRSFTVDCGYGTLTYTATVEGANTYAVLKEEELSGVKVNGRFLQFGPAADDGWDYDSAAKVLTLGGADKTYAITNTLASWDGTVEVAANATVVLEAMNIAASGNAMRLVNGAAVTLCLAGSSTLKSTAEGKSALNVPYGTSLVITNASDAAVAELHATATGWDGAAIGGDRRQNCGNITLAGGRVIAASAARAAGIGGGAQSNGAAGQIRITGGYVEASNGTYGGSGIGSGRRFNRIGNNAPAVIISGGTVKASGSYYSKFGAWGADIGRGLNNSGGGVTITGGSVLATHGRINPAPTANGARVWCVSVEGVGVEELRVECLEGYGLNDVEPIDGNLYFYLPNGNYEFKVNGENYIAAVKDANTTAVRGTLTGVTVGGVDVAVGFGSGWAYDAATHYVEVTEKGAYVLSGTNTAGAVMFAIDDDAEVTLDNLSLRCTTQDECCLWATNGVNVTLYLKGTNTLDASGNDKSAEMGEGLCIENGTRLTITNAPGHADAVLIAKGGFNCAAIAVGRNGNEGAKPYFEIAGGTVYANWFDVPAEFSAGIGASYKTGKNGETDIVISGGFVYAKGGRGYPGIGAADSENQGAPDIRITGGYVEAVGGEFAAGIGGAYSAVRYGNVTIEGGTVRARGGSGASDLIAGIRDEGGGDLTISGGSVLATHGNVSPAPSNGTDRVWCVTVPNLTPNAAVALTGLDGYGADDIVSDADGKVYLWLTNGVYRFAAVVETVTNRYRATVDGANVIATQVPDITPVAPGQKIDCGTAGAATAFAAELNGDESGAKRDAWLVAPGEVDVSGTPYKTYFAAVAEGQYVWFELNAAGSKEVATAEQEATSNLLATVLAATGETATLAIGSPIKGFYYCLAQAETLAGTGTAIQKLAGEGGKTSVAFDLTKWSASGFYWLGISPVPLLKNAADNSGTIPSIFLVPGGTRKQKDVLQLTPCVTPGINR